MSEEHQTTPQSAGVRATAGELLKAYRAVDKLDRWSGGGQTLALVVKVFGWVGLLCVLWVLFVKVSDIAAALDPVKKGIVRLEDQLEQARSGIADEDTRRQQEARRLAGAGEALAASTLQLQRSVAALSSAQGDAAKAAAESTRALREAADKLRLQLNDSAERSRADTAEAADRMRAQALDEAAAHAALLKALGDASQLANRARETIANAGDGVDLSARAVSAAAERTAAALEALRRGATEIDPGALKRSVAKAQAASQELTAVLEKAAREQAPRLAVPEPKK